MLFFLYLWGVGGFFGEGGAWGVLNVQTQHIKFFPQKLQPPEASTMVVAPCTMLWAHPCPGGHPSISSLPSFPPAGPPLLLPPHHPLFPTLSPLQEPPACPGASRAEE